jgi:hypothetical protein
MSSKRRALQFFTVRVRHPPLEHVVVDLGGLAGVVQLGAEVAVGLRPVLGPVSNLVVVLPPEVLCEKLVGGVELLEVFHL